MASFTWNEEGKRLGLPFPVPVVLFPNETTDQYEAEFLQSTKPHLEAARQRSQRMNFALERARKLVGGNMIPATSCYAAFASPLGLGGAGASGVPARKRQPAQERQHATRQPAPKSQNAGVTLSIGQGFEISASFASGQPTFLQGSVVSFQRPQGTVAPYTNIDYARLLAAHSSIAQTQAHDAAVEKRIDALESQVSQLNSTLHDVRTKAHNRYRLKIRIDLLE
uniref:Uncharacterized protein n=1 Tax=Hyaloperonospora arabidopsidis (strain Emoy2) TaxID=559515 RepID=M4BEZ5_HYAAE